MKNLRQVTIKKQNLFQPVLNNFVPIPLFCEKSNLCETEIHLCFWLYVSSVNCGFALKNGRITNTDVQEMAKVSKPTATRLLTSLSDYLEVKGTTGKGTYYVVKGLTKGSNLSE